MKTQDMRDALAKAREQLDRADKVLESGEYQALSNYVNSAMVWLGHVNHEADGRARRSRMRKSPVSNHRERTVKGGPMFKNQAVIDRIVERCIREKAWRLACQNECRCYATKSERAAVDAYVKERFDAAGAGYSGRWQG